MQITDKSDRLKQLIDARKERDYVLCEEILDEGYVGGRELDDILLELANAAIEVFEEPKNATNRRTRENGIRIAVGADAMSVLRMVLRQALGVVVSGIGIGLLLALALERGLSAVFGDTGTDVTAYT
jgi:hypothetical protein